MRHLLPGTMIAKICELVEQRMCNTPGCDHLGRVCEAPGCSNRICRLHEFHCSKCEQYYCEDCWAAHLEECCVTPPDEYDEALEQDLASAALRSEAICGRGVQTNPKVQDADHGIEEQAGVTPCGRAGVAVR